MTIEQQINIRKAIHDGLQYDLPANDIRMREGIVLKSIDPISRFGFEFFCYRSPECFSEMDWFIRYANNKKLFLDIGSFDGVYALVFAKLNPESKIYAIEPSHEPNCRLLYNAHNVGSIECHKMAFSDHDGELSMSKEWEHFAENSNGDFSVPCTKGDSFLNGVLPDIAKLDVEGHELSVLRGLEETIKRCRPVIFLELHVARVYDDLVKIEDFVSAYYSKIIDTLTGEETEIFIMPDKSDPMQMQDRRLILIP